MNVVKIGLLVKDKRLLIIFLMDTDNVEFAQGLSLFNKNVNR